MLRFLLSLCLLWTGAAQAQFLYQEGRDYHPLIDAIEEVSSPKILEFFWYGCPHCYSVEPEVSAFLEKKPEDISFERVPAIPSERWKPAAEAYYVIEALELAGAHERIFKEVHEKNNNIIIFKSDRLQKFLEKEYGVSAEDFEKTIRSFAVQQKLKRAEKLFATSRLSGVPSFVVNGRYFVPLENKNNHFQRMVEIARLLTK